MKKRVGVVFGGRSGEHEISIRSARSVVEQIDHSKYDVVPLAITNDGAWLSPAESLALFPAETQEHFRSRFGEPADVGDARPGSGMQSVLFKPDFFARSRSHHPAISPQYSDGTRRRAFAKRTV